MARVLAKTWPRPGNLWPLTWLGQYREQRAEFKPLEEDSLPHVGKVVNQELDSLHPGVTSGVGRETEPSSITECFHSNVGLQQLQRHLPQIRQLYWRNLVQKRLESFDRFFGTKLIVILFSSNSKMMDKVEGEVF